MIKIEETPKPIKKTTGRKSGTKWCASDLPEGCHVDNLWHKTFIPTYIKYVSQQDDPWTVDDKAAKSAMQKIWHTVYKKSISYQITTDGPVFAVVSVCSLHV
jgi:hypothetical protein